MNESMLKSLMRLFAIMASINKKAIHVLARNFVESYLTRQFSQKLATRFLLIFDEYFNELATEQDKKIIGRNRVDNLTKAFMLFLQLRIYSKTPQI